jgi:hypothetical protein
LLGEWITRTFFDASESRANFLCEWITRTFFVCEWISEWFAHINKECAWFTCINKSARDCQLELKHYLWAFWIA